MKTNKSFTKRLKVTKNGKIKARRHGQNHFNATESAKTKTKKRRMKTVNLSQRTIRRFLPGVKKA